MSLSADPQQLALQQHIAAVVQQQVQQALAAAQLQSPPPFSAASSPPAPDAVLQQLQQQQQQIAQHQQHMQQLLALQAQAQQQHAAPVAAAAHAAPRSAAPRLPPPGCFDGTASRLDDWVADLRQQFEWYHTAADDDRIRFACGFLRGAARDWWTHLADGAAQPATWDAMVAALRARFQPVTTAETARAKLLALSQGKASVHDYVAAFRRLLVAVPKMDEDDRLFQFTRGLQPAIATQLRVQGVKTLDAAIEMATRIGSVKDMHAMGASALPVAASSAAHAPSPMDLDALLTEGVEGLEPAETSSITAATDAPITRAEFQQLLNAMREQRSRAPMRGAGASGGSRAQQQGKPRALPTISHLSPAQVKEYMDANKCFSCGSTDHINRFCPTKRPKQGN